MKFLLVVSLLMQAAAVRADDPQDLSKENRSLAQWKICKSFSRNGTLAGFRSGANLPAECVPQVLYSWGTTTLIDQFQRMAPPNEAWAQDTQAPIFSHVDPIATFAYGDVAVRVKLKSTTSFYVLDGFAGGDASETCSNAKASQLDVRNTVFLHAWENFAPAARDTTL